MIWVRLLPLRPRSGSAMGNPCNVADTAQEKEGTELEIAPETQKTGWYVIDLS